MNATLESYKEPIRRIADEFMDRRHVMASNDTRGKKPMRRVQEHLEELGRLILNTTFVVVLLIDAIGFVADKIPHRSLSNAPNSVQSTPEPKKPVVAVSESSTELVKSDEVVKGSGTLAKYTAETGNGSTSPFSKNLTSQLLNSSFIRTRSGSNSHVARNAAVQTPRAVTEASSRQVPRFTRQFKSLAKLPVPANHSSPGFAGLPMTRCAPINPILPCIIFKASIGQSAINRTPSF
jgi:hypothetical protein